MRNPFKRQPRPAEKPSLRERAAILKSRLARLLTRPAGQGEADQHRRALVAGSVAAALPLPALARTAPPATVTVEALPLALPALITGPHPDRALLDLAAALAEAKEVEARAARASAAANATVNAVLRARPIALVPSHWEWRAVNMPAGPLAPTRRARMHHIPTDLGPLPDDHQRWQNAWTSEGLRYVIANAVRLLGKGGRTPHHIAHWKALLPIADAFDAEVTAAMAASDYKRLGEEREAAAAVVRRLSRRLSRAPATTPEGLAVHVRALIGAGDVQEGRAFAPLFLSAAAIAGVTLPASNFDVPAWVSAWEQAGGTFRWFPQEDDEPELGFVWPRTNEVGPEKTAELQRLSCLQSENGPAIRRWLQANR